MASWASTWTSCHLRLSPETQGSDRLLVISREDELVGLWAERGPKETGPADLLHNTALTKRCTLGRLRELPSFSSTPPAALWWDRVSENKAHVPLPWASVPEPRGKEAGYSDTWDRRRPARSRVNGAVSPSLTDSPLQGAHGPLCCPPPGPEGHAGKKASLFVLLLLASLSLLPKEAFPVGD